MSSLTVSFWAWQLVGRDKKEDLWRSGMGEASNSFSGKRGRRHGTWRLKRLNKTASGRQWTSRGRASHDGASVIYGEPGQAGFMESLSVDLTGMLQHILPGTSLLAWAW